MRLLVTGVSGQLGYDVVRELDQRGHDVIGVDRSKMDITDRENVRDVIRSAGAECVIHCAAYTAVDAAEDHREDCYNVNVNGTEYIVDVCRELDLSMVYISTDYVFDGKGDRPWEPDDKREPINYYGQTKYQGERLVTERLDKYFIIRTAWVFGLNGKNFVRTMLKLGRERKQITVVDDQTGSPTYTYDLARLIADLAVTDKYGVYHATNEGCCTWYQFALEIFKQAEIKVEVLPVTSDVFPSKAKRPANSRLSKDKLEEKGFLRLPPWQDALGRYLQSLKEADPAD